MFTPEPRIHPLSKSRALPTVGPAVLKALSAMLSPMTEQRPHWFSTLMLRQLVPAFPKRKTARTASSTWILPTLVDSSTLSSAPTTVAMPPLARASPMCSSRPITSLVEPLRQAFLNPNSQSKKFSIPWEVWIQHIDRPARNTISWAPWMVTNWSMIRPTAHPSSGHHAVPRACSTSTPRSAWPAQTRHPQTFSPRTLLTPNSHKIVYANWQTCIS